MKEQVYKMHFQADGSVNLYEEITRINGKKGLFLVAMLNGVQAAKERARELCPDGYKVRLLNIQTADLALI